MKRFLAITTLLAFAGIILTGCATLNTSATTLASSAQASAAETSGAESETTEAPVSTHNVEVTDQSVTTLTDDSGDEYKIIIPKLIVDGKEADAINAALSDHISKNHILEKEEYLDGDTQRYYVSGETTRYAWGVRGNIVSIIIIASETFTDGVRYEIFNYNVDTLQASGNEEVISTLGMTTDEFCNKVADAYRAYWDRTPYLSEYTSDLDKSVNGISLTNTTPFITPNGDIGAAGTIYMSQSQFPEMVRCFDLDTLEEEYFAN